MDGVQAIAGIHETQAALPFGELLVSKGLLSREELEKVLDEQHKKGGRLGENLLRLEKLNHEDVTLALAEHLSMEYIRL
nr:type II secretion system protein GspE [Planctomycetota bacterium]